MASNNSGIIKIGLLAGGAYAAYKMGFLSFLGIGAPATPTPAAPATPAPNPNAVTGANSLDGIHQQLSAMVTAPAGVDAWGYALNQILAKAGKGAAPDPMPIFSAAISGFDRSQLLSDGQYWAVMAPALKTQLGLSGLGIYGGLAAMAHHYRRAG